MEGIAVLIVVLVIFAIIRAIVVASNRDSARRQVQQHIRQAMEEGLKVTCTDSFYLPENGGSPLPLKKIAISGSIVMPAANQPVQFRVRIADVTESVAKPYPVFCMISDLADENGIYAFDQGTRIPYQFSQVSDMTITTLPLFALLAPKHGQRLIRVAVAVTPVHRFDPVFAGGTATFTYTQDRAGYTEIRERTRAQERQIAMLALAMSAADGSIDRRESTAIRRFFTERYAALRDGEDRREKTTQALKETLDQLRSGQEKPTQMIARLCEELREDGDSTVAQVAYELCVQVIAADETVKERERKALEFVAQGLHLPDRFVREIHDRNLRLSMYDEAEEEQLIGMPPGLSDEQKREFLNREYRKWRARVTHNNPEVAAEASLRLERITKLRRQLSDG